MTNTRSSTQPIGIWSLIKVPAIITLAVTVVRLVGELEHWSNPLFDQQSGIIGITWIAPLFAIYFAVKLVRAGQGPESTARALGFAAAGVLVAVVGMTLISRLPRADNLHGVLVRYWGLSALAAIVSAPAWRGLLKVQLAYGYAARIPVAIIMFFAIRGNWGTHYDAAPSNFVFLNSFTEYLWIGFVPQLLFWIGFTIVSGMFCGSVTAAVMRLAGRSSHPSRAIRAA
jgi:hypothetical protein